MEIPYKENLPGASQQVDLTDCTNVVEENLQNNSLDDSKQTLFYFNLQGHPAVTFFMCFNKTFFIAHMDQLNFSLM